jgi:hypothetical protein
VILSNIGSMNVYNKTNQLADIFLKNYTSGKSSDSARIVERNNTMIDSVTAKYMSGKYISDDGVRFSFSFKDQKLIWESPTGARPLIQSAEGVFEEPGLQMKFVFNESTKDTTIHQYLTGYDRILTKYIPDITFISKHPNLYTGVYYSPELESRVDIILKDEQLVISGIKVGDMKLTILDRNNMMTSFGSPL